MCLRALFDHRVPILSCPTVTGKLLVHTYTHEHTLRQTKQGQDILIHM